MVGLALLLLVSLAAAARAAEPERTPSAAAALDPARLDVTIGFGAPVAPSSVRVARALATDVAPAVSGTAPPAEAEAPIAAASEEVQGGSGGTEVIEYYGYDALGSVRMVFDAAGNVVGQATYAPYGNEVYGANGMPSQRFTGQERDHEAGLDYFGARFYQARTGRFGAPDPLFGPALEQPQRWNRYAYALANPISFSDPTGLLADDDICQIVFCWTDSTTVVGVAGGGRPREPNPSKDYGSGSLWNPRLSTGGLFDVPDVPPIVGAVVVGGAVGSGAAEVAAVGAAVVLGTVAVVKATEAVIKKVNESDGKNYATYVLSNPATGQKYVGRTSGYGTGQEIANARYAQHMVLRAAGFGPPVVDQELSGRLAAATIRGREQLMIEAYGGPNSSVLVNQRNEISRFSPAYYPLTGLAVLQFGPVAPLWPIW